MGKLFNERGKLNKQFGGVRVRVTDRDTGALLGMQVFRRPLRFGLRGFVRTIIGRDVMFIVAGEDLNPPFIKILV